MATATAATFETLERNLKVSGADLVERVKAVITFVVGEQAWTLDLTSGAGSLERGASDSADLTLTMNDETFQRLVSGKTSPQQAFLFRKLKIKGSMAKALKVSPVLEAARDTPSKL